MVTREDHGLGTSSLLSSKPGRLPRSCETLASPLGVGTPASSSADWGQYLLRLEPKWELTNELTHKKARRLAPWKYMDSGGSTSKQFSKPFLRCQSKRRQTGMHLRRGVCFLDKLSYLSGATCRLPEACLPSLHLFLNWPHSGYSMFWTKQAP